MKKLIFGFAAGALFTSIAIFGHSAFREKLKPDASGVITVDVGDDCLLEIPPSTAAAAGDTSIVEGPSRGIASFYGVSTNGTRTASGVPLKDSASTAAHRTLPFGTLVRVTNLTNGLSETVEITDRGPFIKGRIIDLSRNAAEKLDMIEAGIISVEIEVLPEGRQATPRPLADE